MVDALRTNGRATVVLVHGAFADSSSWNGVIERLQATNVQVEIMISQPRAVTDVILQALAAVAPASTQLVGSAPEQ